MVNAVTNLEEVAGSGRAYNHYHYSGYNQPLERICEMGEIEYDVPFTKYPPHEKRLYASPARLVWSIQT